jgi:hypothetical protein
LGSPYPWHFTARWLYYYLWPSTRRRGHLSPQPLTQDIHSDPEAPLLRLVFFGDLMPIGAGRTLRVAESLRNILAKADLVIGNCEAPVGDTTRTSALSLRMSSDSLAEALAGLNVTAKRCLLSVANNHIGDGRAAGLSRTREHLGRLGVTAIGCEDADGEPVTLRGCRGLNLGFAAWTHWLNKNPFKYAPGVLRTERISAADWPAIRQSLGIDLLIGFPHWEWEFQHFPRPETRDLAARLLGRGFDLIVGHHPHVLQPLTIQGDSHCFFSLGNLTGPAASTRLVRWPLRLGALLEARFFSSGARRGQLAGYTLHPFFQQSVQDEHHLLPIDQAPPRLRRKLHKRLGLIFR